MKWILQIVVLAIFLPFLCNGCRKKRSGTEYDAGMILWAEVVGFNSREGRFPTSHAELLKEFPSLSSLLSGNRVVYFLKKGSPNVYVAFEGGVYIFNSSGVREDNLRFNGILTDGFEEFVEKETGLPYSQVVFP